MTIGGKGALISVCENAGILVGTRLRATTRTRWMMLWTWMDRFVAKLVPVSGSITYAYTHTFILVSSARGEWGRGRGCVRSQWGTNSLSRAPPTLLSPTRLWMDLNGPDVAAALSDPKWAARNTTLRLVSEAPISPSINPVSPSVSLFLSPCGTYYSDGEWCENNSARIWSERARDKYCTTTCWLAHPAAADDFKLRRSRSPLVSLHPTIKTLRIFWE